MVDAKCRANGILFYNGALQGYEGWFFCDLGDAFTFQHDVRKDSLGNEMEKTFETRRFASLEEAEGRILSKPRADGGTGWSLQIENGQVEFVGVGEPVPQNCTGKASVNLDTWTMVTGVFTQQRRGRPVWVDHGADHGQRGQPDLDRP